MPFNTLAVDAVRRAVIIKARSTEFFEPDREIAMGAIDISDLFQVVCLGAKRCGEFIEATCEAALDGNAARLRRQAQAALSTPSSYLLAEAGKHYMLGDDELLKDLERFASPDFLKD